MDYVKRLNDEVKKGFTKTYLENLIGLPKNTLAGFLKGSKKMTSANQALIVKFFTDNPELDILSMPKRTRKPKVEKPATSVGVVKQAVRNMCKEPVAVNVHEDELKNEKEPKEGSMAFMYKYGVSTYEELKNK